MKKIICLILIIQSIGCSSNQNIEESISKLKKSNSIIFTLDQIQSKLKLINDSVYNVEDNKPITGQIQVLGKYELVDENGNIQKKEGLIAMFNLKNGGFDGDQIYLSASNNFIKTNIIPNLDMIKGIDFIQVNENESSDYFYGYPKKFVKLINRKFIDNIEITKYYTNGNLMITGKYLFNFENFILAAIDESTSWKYNDSRVLILNNEESRILHYNKKIAYLGPIIKGILDENGKFYNLKGNTVNSTNFFLAMGNNNLKLKDIEFNIKDDEYKSFRKYFNSYEIKISENIQPHIETEEEKNLRLDELVKNKIYSSSEIIGKPFTFKDNFEEREDNIYKPKPINIEVAEFDFPDMMSYEVAIEKCKQLGNGWRLPTFNELDRIRIHKSEIKNLHTSSIGDDCRYWTANKDEYSENEAKVVIMYFNSTEYYTSNINTKLYVRAVKDKE